MIGEFINNYSEIGYAGIVIITMIWLVRYLVKQTTEDKMYYREIITNDMKDLHIDSLKNAELNKQTIILQNGLAKDIREHNGHSKKAWDKAISSLGIICERLNGGDPKIKKELEWYKRHGIIDRRSINEKVSVERRK